MSEMKRVELTTVSTSQKQKKVKWKQSTYRFVLTLGESNSETCPEYSFADLVKNEKPLSGNPFDEPDEDKEVAAIAQRFEAKYGPKTLFSGKRKRTQEMDDYYDPGEGYDEDDPFIDNTEAHDEVVPSSMTTQHGGFYINQGKLDFKCLDENSSDAFTSSPLVKKKKKQRVLGSDSEEESGPALKKKFQAMKRKRQLESKGEEKPKKKMSISEGGDIIFRKKKVKKVEKSIVNSSVPDSQKEGVTPSILPPTSVPTPSLSSSPITIPNKITTVANGVLNDVPLGPGKGGSDVAEEMPSAIFQSFVKEDSSSKSGDEAKGDNQPVEKNIVLPPQLPPELIEAIENIKREAKESKEKKLRFFSDDVNKLLLDIELRSHNLAWGNRTAIYNYLAEHLPCGKQALLRRVKKLRESQEESQLKVPIQQLKEAIMKVMPALEEQHGLDVQKAKMESELKGDVADVKEEASTESEGEEKSDVRKKPRGPRRKFQWTSEMRDLLLKIVSIKMKLYQLHKSRNQTPKEYLNAFLDSDIKPLWPQGWMQTRMLFKESRKAHESLTKSALIQGKQRKASTATDGATSNIESTRTHVSKTEDVIEISSILESDEEKNSIVVINLSSSDSLNMGQVASASTAASVPSIVPSTPDQTSKQSFKTISATLMTTQSVPVNVISSHKVAEPSSSSSVKRVTPAPVLDSPYTPSAKNTFTTKSFSPGYPPNAASTPEAHGSNAQMPSSIHQQHYNQYNLQQKSVPSQQIVNIPQQKLPQELQKTTNLQLNKAAIRYSSPAVVNKVTPNSSWASVKSIEPAHKLINPVVAVNRIPETSVHKLSKSNHTSLSQSQAFMPQNQLHENVQSNTVFKPYEINQKQQQGASPNTSATSGISHLNKSGAVSHIMSSRDNLQNKTNMQQNLSLQKSYNLQNPHLKSGIAINNSSSSVQKLGQQHNQTLKTGTIVGMSALSSDFPGWTSQSSLGNMKQSLSPEKLMQSAVSKSPSSATLPQSTPSSGLLNINSMGLSRNSTPSPQKSPVSPEGNASLSVYEQIKSQVWHQEAMVDQALKNLAIAKYGGSGVPNVFGQGGDTSKQPGGR